MTTVSAILYCGNDDTCCDSSERMHKIFLRGIQFFPGLPRAILSHFRLSADCRVLSAASWFVFDLKLIKSKAKRVNRYFSKSSSNFPPLSKEKYQQKQNVFIKKCFSLELRALSSSVWSREGSPLFRSVKRAAELKKNRGLLRRDRRRKRRRR